MNNGETSPWWLEWVLPVTAAVTALGGALIWLGRVVLLPGVKGELEGLLRGKFEEAHKEMQLRHEQNQSEIKRLQALLDQSAVDRKQIHDQLTEVLADVSYLRGKAANNERSRR